MKKLEVNSKKYGKLYVLLDDEDYEKLKRDFNNMKWSVSINPRNNDFYFNKRKNKIKYLLHRYIMNCPKGMYVDHINHNTLDNRKCNLRIVSNADNLRNGNIRANNKTGIKGVHYNKIRKKYIATIKVNYKNINLGSFDNIEEARKVRKLAEEKFWNTGR